PFEGGTEIKVRWIVYDKQGREVDSFEHSTTGRLEDWDKGSERMISRFAYRAAPDIAVRLGKTPAPEPPEHMSWSVLPGMPPPPGERRPAGGLPVIPDLPPLSELPKPGDAAAARPAAAPVAMSRFPKVRVAQATGAPGDGNATLTRAMRHSLGASRMILMERIDPQVFTVTAVVTITPPQDKKQHVVIKWTVTDPAGVLVGDLEQANDVPAGSLNGPWGGLADVIAIA